jgi:ABC-2 type transport system ATP-binding protein
MPERDILYRERSVLQNLVFHAAVRNCSGDVLSQRVSSALTESNTVTVRDRRVAELSAGWRRMAQLACAIVHKPRILILDEPCAGLDWAARNRLWRIVRRFKDTGASVIISTQELREAMKCDKIIVLVEGRIAAQGTRDSLTPGDGLEMPAVVTPTGSKTEQDRIAFCPEALAVLGEYPGLRVVFQGKGAALEAMKKLGIPATDFSLVSPSLEEIYIGVTCASRNRQE